MKKISFVFLLATFLFSCDSQATQQQNQPGKDGFIITGKVKYPQKGYVVLTELQEKGFVPIDSVKLNIDNTYTLKGKVKEPGFYMLSFFDLQKVLVILENKNLEVNADGNAPTGSYAMKGTKDVEDLQKITKIQNELQAKANELMPKFQAATAKKDDKAREDIQNRFMAMQNQSNRQLKELVRQIGPSLPSWYATNLLNPEDEFPFLDSLARGFEKTMPDSKYTKELVAKLTPYKNMINVGQQAPEITLNNPQGQPVSLSSLRGKYVLIDFWASWCGPCRQENPNVVRMYNQFKGKNFEIFGVSLDQSKDKWVAAIEKDNLSWVHVSDLKYWQSAAAQTYGVQGIPATFLLDPNGKIIAKNLRGKALEEKLAQVLAAK